MGLMRRQLDDDYRKVAMDAMMEGRVDEGEKILASVGVRLTKPQAKLVAKVLVKDNRMDAAMRVLTRAYGKEGAERELRPPPAAKVGDILYTSWGYEQTNIDFYQVTDVHDGSVTIRKIASRVVSGGRGTDEVVAVPDDFVGPPMKKRVQKGYRTGEYEVKISEGRGHAWQWDGKPKHQTAAGYGH